MPMAPATATTFEASKPISGKIIVVEIPIAVPFITTLSVPEPISRGYITADSTIPRYWILDMEEMVWLNVYIPVVALTFPIKVPVTFPVNDAVNDVTDREPEIFKLFPIYKLFPI